MRKLVYFMFSILVVNICDIELLIELLIDRYGFYVIYGIESMV